MVEKSQDRDDAAKVYRFLRDHGEATLAQIVDACLPVIVGGPPSTVKAIKRRSYGRALDAIEYMRRQGVDLTCLSRPGSRSGFVLGRVAQGVEAYAVYKRAMTPLVGEEGSDLMEIWHQNE